MPVTTALVLNDAVVLDTRAGLLRAGRRVVIENGRITEVGTTREPRPGEPPTVELGGKTLMPGLCDAHVHVTAATADFAQLKSWSPSYVTTRAAVALEAMLMRGFTTVRDAGGADYGLAQAIDEGYIRGPRLLFCGHALSQTGGHGDMRGPGQHALDSCFCCAGLGRICDGVDEVRRASRDELRKGASQLKIMASGGVASPTDRIDSTQFSEDEIVAAVQEAEAANRYVMAHAYTARAINRALRCGVRSIEHGNLLDESSIELFLQCKAFLVPTLSTYQALARDGLAAGLPAALHDKVYQVLDAGLQALALAHRCGVSTVYGTDLLGPMQASQLNEFSLRSAVMPAAEIIRSATSNAADCFQMSGEIGEISVGARADLLVVDGDPLSDLAVLQDPQTRVAIIMKDGVVYKDLLRSGVNN